MWDFANLIWWLEIDHDQNLWKHTARQKQGHNVWYIVIWKLRNIISICRKAELLDFCIE